MSQNEKTIMPTVEKVEIDVDKDSIIEKQNETIIKLKESNENLVELVTKLRKALTYLSQDVSAMVNNGNRSLEITQLILESNK